MNEILNKLNRAFNDKYYFLKIYNVIYDKSANMCTFTFLFPCNVAEIESEDRHNIEKFIKKDLELNCEVKIKLKKSFLDQILIMRELLFYFNNYKKSLLPYIFEDNITIKSNELNVNIEIKINKDILYMIDEIELKNDLMKFLNEKFIANFEILIKENDDTISTEINAPDILPENKKRVERYKVEVLKKIVGGDIIPEPEYIKNNTKPKTSVILCGILTNINKKTFKIKKGKKAGEDKALYTFNIDDGNKIECIYFCSKTNEKIMDSLEEGMLVLCVGDLNIGLSGNLTYYIRKMSWASIKENQNFEKKETEIKQFKHKTVVIPEKLHLQSQSFLFDEKILYNENVQNKNIVVFDIETTGLNPEEDEITEIGAIKIENGIITEKFASFVKPTIPIPLEVQKLTNITDDMVKNAPNINDVIFDFYKFADNCVLSGHNIIGFDFKFIKKAGENIGLNFSNKLLDTLILARSSSLRLPNYKLGTIVNALGLTLEGAHRAYNDAFATAQVLLELCKIKK